MDFNFDEVIDRRPTASEKWDRYADRDIIPLWVADMDFRSAPAIIEALHRRIDHGVFGYTNTSQELTDATVNMVQSSFGWRIEPQWLVWIPGLVCGLNITCKAVGHEGDGVMTAAPVYPPFFTAPQNAGRTLIRVPLQVEGDRWSFDFDGFENAVTASTRLFLLCNPHNPVGRVFSRNELTRLADFCTSHDMVICSDEIHNGLILDTDKPHIPIATLSPEIAQRTITLMAPSKTFNIPGLGCSFAIIPNETLRRQFKRAMAGIVPYVNLLGLTATLAAFRDCAEWHTALLEYLRANRAAVYAVVRRMPGCRVYPVEATYLAWIDTTGAGLNDPAPFFETAGVGLSNGKDFGAEGFVRLNFGCPRPLLDLALDRMEAAMSKASR
jgi:cystathionine beta-lyase